MVDLIATSPLDDLLPLSIGTMRLKAATPDYITSIMPHAGKMATLNAVVNKSHDMALPATGRITGKASLKAVWTGRGQYFLMGDKPAANALAEHAAITDQSDGWVVMRLTGPNAADVLARLCPVDLRSSQFKTGHTARTEIAHMMVVLSKVSSGFEIMVMRSFTKTLVHHLQNAMTSVAAQSEM